MKKIICLNHFEGEADFFISSQENNLINKGQE